jgi:hypothetical protein
MKTSDDPVAHELPQATGSPILAACRSLTVTVLEPDAVELE